MKQGQLVRISRQWDGIVIRPAKTPGWFVVAYVEFGKQIVKSVPLQVLEKRK